MKKFILLLTLLLPLAVIAEEIVTFDGVAEPNWKDFVPSAYVDVQEPKGLGKLNETAAYWYKRRVDFENAINDCRNLETNDAKYSCYQQVKVKQYQENSEYNAKIEAQEQSRMGPPEMYDRTDTMIPIGGYLNNFTRFQPNELH